MLDVIIGWVSSNDADTITAGRSFYFYDEHNHYLGGGAEAWSGYSQVWECVKLCVHGAEAWSGYSHRCDDQTRGVTWYVRQVWN